MNVINYLKTGRHPKIIFNRYITAHQQKKHISYLHLVLSCIYSITT